MSDSAAAQPAQYPLVRLTRYPARIVQVFRHHGAWKGFGVLVNLSVDRWTDRRFGISTSRCLPLSQLGIESEDYVDYAPTNYLSFRAALRHCPRELHKDDVFIDFGAGRGRVLLEAAKLPLRRVIGVEFLPELADEAEQNLAVASQRVRFRCGSVEIIQQDATQYPIPEDATVLHFFNPFRGPVLEKVIDNLAASLRANPRRIIVLFANPDDFHRILQKQSPIPPKWVRSDRVVAWPLYQKSEDELGNVYRIYEIEPS